MTICFRWTGIGVLAAAGLMAQGTESSLANRVRGEISPAPPGISSLTVELSANGNSAGQIVHVAPDGSFEFRASPRGAYELKLVGPGGAVIHQETVMLTGSSQLLSIRIGDTSQANRSTGGTVSLQQLSHKVPPLARKAFDKGEQAQTKGRYDEAAAFYRQAVSIDPEYADAFNELGAMEARQGDLAHAVEDFQKAVEAVPEHAMALSNLSIVLAKLRRFEEAAEAARRALRAMPGSGTQHFVLATSLLFSSGDSDEVLDNFERSAAEVPRGHLVAAQLLVRRGRREDAVRHLQDFLRLAPPGDREREKAEALLGELRQQ
jgi:tetratricopeptide (TPR) repeat protein